MLESSDAKYQDRVREEIEHYNKVYDNATSRRTLTQSNPPSWRYMEGRAWRLIRQVNEGRGPYREIAHHIESCGGGRILSIGSGPGGQEIGIARDFQRNGTRYEILCLDLNPDLIALGQERSIAEGLNIAFKVQDINLLRLDENEFDVIMCFASLHHLVDLEQVFYEMNRSLKPSGELVVVDIITRNGFLMWDETYQVVQDIWKILPERFKVNFTVGEKPHVDPEYPHFNQGLDSMECVRSEDIVPLLDEYFVRKVYVPYFSIARRLCDTMYGPCYDLSRELDKAIVEMIWHLDVHLVKSGKLKPETFFGVYTKGEDRPRPTDGGMNSKSAGSGDDSSPLISGPRTPRA